MSTVSDAFDFSAEEINARGKAITTSVLHLFEKIDSKTRAEIVNAAFQVPAEEITPRAQVIEKVILPLFGDQHSSWQCVFTLKNAFNFSIEEITARGKAIQSILPLFEKFNSEECAEIVNAAFQTPAKEITQRAQTIVKSVLPLFDAQHSSWECLYTLKHAFELSAEEITARAETITQVILPLFTNKISPALRAQIVVRAFQLSAAEIKSGGVSLFKEIVEKNKEDTTPLTSSTLTKPSQPEPSSPFLQGCGARIGF